MSSTIALTLCAPSSASPPRISIPASAPLPVPTMIAVGVASPSAQGQAMIRTAMKACRAKVKRGSGPQTYQPMKVSAERARIAGTK